MHLRHRTTTASTALALAMVGATPLAASAVNANHGSTVVSTSPSAVTPHVMNGTVTGITQVGTKVIVVGTFTSVSPAETFTNKADDLTRNRIFAFDANTGAIDPSFNPNLGGAANSIDTDGSSIYVGGKFGSVGGNATIKRLVKVTSAGQVVSAFNAVPNAEVREVVVRGQRLYVGGAFKKIKSHGVNSNRGALAALDSTTGAVLGSLDLPFTGVYDPNQSKPGTTNVKRFDVTADGSRLVAVGNFSSVGGHPRSQVAVLNTSGSTATVSSWSTTRFDRAHNNCAGVFDTFTRDVDFSPDGSYFVVTTTGAFAGGANANTLCDTSSRWETNAIGNDPSWITYTGGDTTYGVAVTGSAVYVGGHMRWQNNSFQGDQAGPGAVPREGIAALDPVNGLPLSWNPGRTRGVGAQALFATTQGLWVGSDTTLFNKQRRGRIAFLPLSGGTQIPVVPEASLPNNVFLAPQSGGSLLRRPVGPTGAPTGVATTVNAAMDWSSVRGAFLLNGSVYYGLATGGLYKRTFNASTGDIGAQQSVNLFDDPDNGARIPFAITAMTGMFYDPPTHRIYYTVANDSRLYYRYFTPESEVVGAQTFQADAGGVNFGSVAGMTLAGGRVLFGSTDGALRSASFSGGRVTGPTTVLSSDGTWRARALFVPNG
jgi:hypothetical protein